MRSLRKWLRLHDLGAGGVLLHGSDSCERGLLRLVGFADGDDLSVGRLQAEAGLAGLVCVNLELRVPELFRILDRLVLDARDGRVLLNARDAVEHGAELVVDLGGRDHLAVAGEEVEHEAAVGGLLRLELAHCRFPFLRRSWPRHRAAALSPTSWKIAETPIRFKRIRLRTRNPKMFCGDKPGSVPARWLLPPILPRRYSVNRTSEQNSNSGPRGGKRVRCLGQQAGFDFRFLRNDPRPSFPGPIRSHLLSSDIRRHIALRFRDLCRLQDLPPPV